LPTATVHQANAESSSDEGEDLASSSYWSACADRLRARSQPTQATALYQIHKTVSQLLESEAVEDWLGNAYRLAAISPEHISTLSSQEFEGKVREFSEITGRALEILGRQTAAHATESSSSNASYGGDIGGAIFQIVTRSTVLPALTSLIAHFREDTEEFSEDDVRDCLLAFLPVLLKEAGAYRSLIATMTATADAAQFGATVQPGAYMIDRVGEMPEFSRWKSLILDKIHAVIDRPAEFVRGSDLWPEGGHPWACVHEPLLQVTIFNDERVVLHTGEMKGQYGSSCAPTACYTFDYDIAAGEGRGITIRESGLECNRMPAIEHGFDHELVENLVTIIRWDKTRHSLDVLRTCLAKVHHDFSQTTLFGRGQAAITMWLVEAFARDKSHTVAYSEAYTAPTGLTPDVQALCDLNRDHFANKVVTGNELRLGSFDGET